MTRRLIIRAGFPMDLIVRSPRVIQRRLAMDDFFITEILEQGETLYEVQHARVGRLTGDEHGENQCVEPGDHGTDSQ